MSLDTTIAIAKFNDWYRVCHSQAIENVFEKWIAKEYFPEKPVYETKEEALLEGHKMEEEIEADEDCYGINYVEYWVRYIWDLGDYFQEPLELNEE